MPEKGLRGRADSHEARVNLTPQTAHPSRLSEPQGAMFTRVPHFLPVPSWRPGIPGQPCFHSAFTVFLMGMKQLRPPAYRRSIPAGHTENGDVTRPSEVSCAVWADRCSLPQAGCHLSVAPSHPAPSVIGSASLSGSDSRTQLCLLCWVLVNLAGAKCLLHHRPAPVSHANLILTTEDEVNCL